MVITRYVYRIKNQTNRRDQYIHIWHGNLDASKTRSDKVDKEIFQRGPTDKRGQQTNQIKRFMHNVWTSLKWSKFSLFSASFLKSP